MKWFKHDSNAHIDAKIKKVKHKYGITGYGLYWYCIELIAGALDSKNITFELEEDAEIIALEWSLDQLKVQEIMEYMVSIGLFENSNGRISCLKLAKRLDDTNSKNPEIRRILAVLDKVKLGDTPTNSESVLPDKTRLDKTRLEESIKDITPVAVAPVEQKKRFVVPLQGDVLNYMMERKLTYSNANHESEKFCDFYESKNWMVGKTKMKQWKASVRNWLRNNNQSPVNNTTESKRGWSAGTFDPNFLES